MLRFQNSRRLFDAIIHNPTLLSVCCSSPEFTKAEQIGLNKSQPVDAVYCALNYEAMLRRSIGNSGVTLLVPFVMVEIAFVLVVSLF